jgi:LysR family transcriptional regulator, glycine cleavage system transcriptional activator
MDSSHRRPRLSLDLLKGFEAAARHLSFTRAAQELSLTQSAISREIKTLEEQLGRPLFNRVSRGLGLTDDGRELYRAVGEALKLIDEATDRLAGPRRGDALTVTTSVALASTWLVPRLSRFLRLHPDVDVRCVGDDQRLDLERERLDLAIRWAPPRSSVPGGERLFDLKSFPVCSPTLARDRTRPLRSPADLAKHVLLDLETLTALGPWSDWAPWLEAMKLGNLKPAGVLRFSQYDQVVQAAIDGSGIAIGRSPHSARQLRDDLLVAPFGQEAVLNWGAYFILVAPRSAERAIVKDFVAWLRSEARQDAEAAKELERSSRGRAARPAARARTRKR